MKIFVLLAVFFAWLACYLYIRKKQKEYDGSQESKIHIQEPVIEKQFRKNQEEVQQKKQKLLEDPQNSNYGRVLIRPIEAKDAKDLATVVSTNRDLAKSMDLPTIKRVSQMQQILNNDWLDRLDLFSIVIFSSQRVIGLAWYEQDDNSNVHLKLLMGKRYLKFGFGSEAAKALINRAYEDKVEKIIADVDSDNEIGIEFAKSLGFTQEDSAFILEPIHFEEIKKEEEE